MNVLIRNNLQGLKNQKGLSLIEVLISSAITIFIFSTIISALVGTNKQIQEVSKSSKVTKSAIFLAQSLLLYPQYYQPYPKTASCFANTSQQNKQCNDYQGMYEKMPFAIDDKSQILSVEECNGCFYRMGVFLVPSSQIRTKGMFEFSIYGIKKKQDNSYEHIFFKNMLIPIF